MCKGLGFSRSEPEESALRIGWLCALLGRYDINTVSAVISPYRETRARLKLLVPNFVEVYVKTPLQVCVERDVKGMYPKAMRGEIRQFTGVDAPYEEPLDPDIVVETDKHDILACTRHILNQIIEVNQPNRCQSRNILCANGSER